MNANRGILIVQNRGVGGDAERRRHLVAASHSTLFIVVEAGAEILADAGAAFEIGRDPDLCGWMERHSGERDVAVDVVLFEPGQLRDGKNNRGCVAPPVTVTAAN